MLLVTVRSALVKEQYDTSEPTGANDQSIRFDRPSILYATDTIGFETNMHAWSYVYRKKLERTRSQQTGNGQPHLISPCDHGRFACRLIGSWTSRARTKNEKINK